MHSVAVGVDSIRVVNRTASGAESASELAAVAAVGAIDDIETADLVVNASSVGMGIDQSAATASDLPCSPEVLQASQIVVDLVYHPLQTAWLAAAERVGARTIDGLGMLIHQAALQQLAWLGRRPDVAVMRRVPPKRRWRNVPRGEPAGGSPEPSTTGDSLDSMLRYLTAGESHGQALVVVMEGLPAGLPITVEQIQVEMGRRRLGYGRGPRQRFEADELTLIGGVRHGRTLGSPIAIEIKNSEWFRSDKWHEEMSPAPGATKTPLTQVRPGHADLAGMQKYGFTDARDVLERASARETAARVAAGAVAKALLSHIGVEIISHVIQMGAARVPADAVRPTPDQLDRVDENQVRCFDLDASEAMIGEIKAAAKDGDSLGGVVEVLGFGVPVGLGSHVHWDRKLDALLAQAIMSIQAVKGVEIGDGFEVAGRRGSVAHDPISWDADAGEYRRGSTLAGGTEGGISTGELLVVRAAMKPLATLNVPTLETVDTATKESTVSFKERTDVTAVPAMGVVAETMVALVLAAEAQRKFGGDSLDEFVRNAEAFAATLP